MQPDPSPADNPELDALIAGYLEAVERAEAPDRRKLLADHPQHAAALEIFFADLDRMPNLKPQPADPQFPPTIIAAGAADATVGTILGGRYKLLENIGQGGMGSVWVAEQQQPVKRKVAIKLVKPGMDTRQVLARFEAERQALALMDHPHIAKVFDGGMTDQGRPYFVMEYVKGIPFNEYCDQAKLSLNDRLKLFLPVCQAVQHAHHKGIVHRDLKPSNILVCLYDGQAIPKVIDFGLAKALHQPLTEQTLHTAHGVMVGTPLYMSPEQAEYNNLDVDTRTDIYSLGVVLYELLTGTTPLERGQFQKAAYEEVLRIIREVEPQRPSLRLSGGATLPSVAAQRSINPRELCRSLAGDLDWIVMKALEKERSRRYETANGLARDIERFLNEEAIEARPPSTAYRVRKFVRKHKGQVIAAGAVVAALVVGIIGIGWGYVRATNAEQAAREAEENAVEAEQKTLAALDDVTIERDAKEVQRRLAQAAADAERAAKRAEEQQRIRAERELALGILRPIGFGDRPNTAELRSLADWSALGDPRLQLMVLDVAFEDPELVLRVARRAGRVIQVCVGLSPTRRAKAIEFLSTKQRELDGDPRAHIAACWLSLELGATDLPALAESVRYLGDPKHGFADEFKLFISLAVRHNAPTQGAVFNHELADELIDLQENCIDSEVQAQVAKALTELAPHLDAAHVSRWWNALMVPRMRSVKKSAYLSPVETLPVAAQRLDEADANRAADTLVSLLEDSFPGNIDEYRLTKGLLALDTRLSTKHRSRLVAALVSLLEKTKNDQQQWEAARGLASQLSRLDAVQVNRVGDVLLERISISTDFLVLKEAGQCLVALAPQLELAKLTRAGDRFVTLLDKSHDGQVIEAATKCLVELAPWMQDSQVTLGWDSIVARTEKSTDKVILAIANNPLIVLAPHLNSKDIASRLDKYLSQLHKSTDLGLQRAALAGLIALTPRLDVVETTRSGDALLALLEQSSIAEILAATVEGLVVVAPRLDVTQMTRAGAALVTLLQKSQELSVVMAVANCLQVLTPSQIDPVQVTGAWDALLAMLEKSTQVGGPSIAGRALVALAPWVDGAQVTHALRIMVALLQNSTEVLKVDAAADCLRVLAPSRLDAVHVAGAWNARLALLENSADRAALRVSGRALVALAPWVEEAQVMRCARVLLKLMESSNNSEDRFAAWYTCLALAGRMEVAQRGSVAEALLPSLYKDSDSGGGHSSAFEAILPLLDPLTHDRIVTAALPIVLCFVASNERANDRIVRPDGFDGSESDLAQVAAIWSFAVVMKAHPRSVAKLMSHPGCVGELRELLLQRFEELLFHDGQPVYLKPEPAANAATTPVTNPPPRRFHNLHDAAAWIQHNWPDFDLETNHPLIWRSVK